MTADRAYYDALPKKRMGAGCLFFNRRQELLLVKPTYKPVWEIPGGVVEDNESPKQCCQREVAEEIGLKREIGPLLVIDYNHSNGSKTESLMFILTAVCCKIRKSPPFSCQQTNSANLPFSARIVCPKR